MENVACVVTFLEERKSLLSHAQHSPPDHWVRQKIQLWIVQHSGYLNYLILKR